MLLTPLPPHQPLPLERYVLFGRPLIRTKFRLPWSAAWGDSDSPPPPPVGTSLPVAYGLMTLSRKLINKLMLKRLIGKRTISSKILQQKTTFSSAPTQCSFCHLSNIQCCVEWQNC